MSKNGGVGIYALKVMPMPWHGLWKFGTLFAVDPHAAYGHEYKNGGPPVTLVFGSFFPLP
jgi:hypothetical protein